MPRYTTRTSCWVASVARRTSQAVWRAVYSFASLALRFATFSRRVATYEREREREKACCFDMALDVRPTGCYSPWLKRAASHIYIYIYIYIYMSSAARSAPGPLSARPARGTLVIIMILIMIIITIMQL